MATTITVLSWNIESFGAAKAAQPIPQGQPATPLSKSQIIDFVVAAGKQLNVDVIGIMEIKSGIGSLILSWLLSGLNNNGTAGTVWKGQVSTRQDGGTQEEYIYLWRSTANFDLDTTLMPGPTSLVNVVDTQAFNNFFTTVNITTTAQQTQFFEALAANSYIVKGTWKEGRGAMKTTKTYRVNPGMWKLLSTGAAVAFTDKTNPPPVNFTNTQLIEIGTILTQLDVLRFITYGDRSPYIINLTLDAKPLTIAVYHAPGPQDPTRFEAINIIGMSLPLAPSNPDKNMLLMGDFNIGETQTSTQARVYERASVTGNANAVVFQPAKPVQRAVIFNPIVQAPLNTSLPRLSKTYTSLTTRFITNTAPITDANGNTYDNFYFHTSVTTANQITATFGGAKISLPLQTFIPGQTGYDAGLAKSALLFFKAFRGTTFLTKAIADVTKKQTKNDVAVKRATNAFKTAQQNLNNAKASGGQPTATLQQRFNKTQKVMNAANTKKNIFADELTSLNATSTLIGNPINSVPAGVGDALTIYRYAISDHLAIGLQLQS